MTHHITDEQIDAAVNAWFDSAKKGRTPFRTRMREAILTLAAPQGEPVAWMWQHEETGRKGFVEADQLAMGWEANNPRLKITAPLYTAPAVPSDERWAIVRETALDVGRGSDARTGGRPELGYAVISNAATFGSEGEAIYALRAANLPVGWVVMPVRRLLPDLFTAAPTPPAQPAVPEDVRMQAKMYRWLRDCAPADWLSRVCNVFSKRGAAFDEGYS